MKKHVIGILVLAMMANTVSMLSVSADDVAQLQAGTVTGEIGAEDIAVPIVLSNNPGISSLDFDVEYDTEKLELIEVEDTRLLYNVDFLGSQNITDYPYHISWSIGLVIDNCTAEGTIAVFHFHILDTADEGTSEIKIVFDDAFAQVGETGTEFSAVAFNTSNGSINIVNEETETESESETKTETEEPTETESKELCRNNSYILI